MVIDESLERMKERLSQVRFVLPISLFFNLKRMVRKSPKNHHDRMKSMVSLVFIVTSFLILQSYTLQAQTDTVVLPKTENLTEVDQMPEFPGGDVELYRYIFKKIKYPRNCVAKGISGIVVVKFTIDTLGLLSNIHTVKSLAPEIDAEAIRVIESMNHMKKRWKPGRHEGRAVNVDFTLPIKFVLQ